MAKKFTAKEADITTESYTKASLTATKSITIAASGKSEIELLGSLKLILLNLHKAPFYIKRKIMKKDIIIPKSEGVHVVW